MKYDCHAKKAKYCWAVHNILGKMNVGKRLSCFISTVMVTRVRSRILQYNVETISLSNEALSHTSFVSNAIYSKSFKTFDKIADC